jgi:predicted aspartyl protease
MKVLAPTRPRRRAVALAMALLAIDSPALGNRPTPVAPTKMAPLSPAEIDDELAIGGDDVGARKARTRMTADVLVNGRGPYRFVVDSGADSSVVGQRVATALSLPKGTPVVVNGMTGSARAERVLVDELTLGPTSVHNLELPALRERDLGADGMLGIDALVKQRLMMDFEKRLIKVENADAPPPRLDGEIIVTARTRRGQLILTQVKAAGLTVDAVVDTGSEITIGNIALRNKLIRRNADKFTTVSVTGVTGATMDIQIARIGELRLGSVTLRNIPMAFADVPPFTVFGLEKAPALLLGTDLMETFRRVSLDFRARKVRFQLRKCGSQGITVRTGPVSGGLSRLAEDNAAVCKR